MIAEKTGIIIKFYKERGKKALVCLSKYHDKKDLEKIWKIGDFMVLISL
jgi:hypothetical protein